jgi:hypothetical protein
MAVSAAIRSWDESQPEKARTHLDGAVELAHEMGYL